MANITVTLTEPANITAVGVSVYLERQAGPKTLIVVAYEQGGVKKTAHVDFQADLTAQQRTDLQNALQPLLNVAKPRMGF